MSSPLFRIKIQKFESNQVYTKIFIIHPDQKGIPQSKTFALSILLECWNKMAKGLFFAHESFLPIKESEAKKLSQTSKYAKLFDELNKQAFGYDLYITKKEYEKIQAIGFNPTADSTIYGKQILGWGTEGSDKYYVFLADEFKKFKQEAEKYVDIVKLTNLVNYPWAPIPNFDNEKEKDEFYLNYYKLENVPQGDLYFTVKANEMLDFLVPDIEFETTIWR